MQQVAVICLVEDQDLAAEDSEGNTANEDLVAKDLSKNVANENLVAEG